MYPTLYHAFYDLIGIDWPWLKLLNSFGFFVALAFFAGNWILSSELKRKEKEGILKPEKRKLITGQPVSWSDVGTSALIGFIIGWKFLYLIINADTLFNSETLPQQHIFSLDGYWFWGILLAALFGLYRWYEYRKQQLPVPEERIVDFHMYQYTGPITFYAALGGVIGAKFFHLLEYPEQMKEFFLHFSLNDFLSGLTMYGGLIVGSIVVLMYARKIKLPLLPLMDSAAPALMLAYGIGRIGCQVSGDGDWGVVNNAPKPSWLQWLPDSLWAYDYPNNVNGVGEKLISGKIFEGYGTHLPEPVFPTPVYETTMAVLIFLVLWYLRKKLFIPGVLFGIYMIFNGIERFLIESIRVNSKFNFLGIDMTQAQLISTCMIIGGAIMIFVLWKKRPHENKGHTFAS